MAVVKWTSSQGAFTWATSGVPPTGVQKGTEMLNSYIAEVRANFDWLIDNQETCWANKTVRCVTKYGTYRTTNNDARQTTANDSQYDERNSSKNAVRDGTKDMFLYSTRNDVIGSDCGSQNTHHHASIQSGVDGIVHGVFYSGDYSYNNASNCSDVHTGEYWTVHTNVDTTINLTVNTIAQTSDHGTRDSLLYTTNQGTNHASVDAALDCQAN